MARWNGSLAGLRTSLKGRLLLPKDGGYDAARKIYNCSVDVRPAGIVECANAADVAAAIRFAGDAGWPLSVKCGGHDVEGRALCPGGLVIDLSKMREIQVDAKRQAATIHGGVRAGEILAEAAKAGMVAVTGTGSAIGMGGLILGGGYGQLCGRFGLASDNLVAAEVVLADGTLVRASAVENPDLLWALRGGGGNFGVVASFTVQLHPLPLVLAGVCIYPLPQAGQVLRNYRDFMRECPDCLGMTFGFLAGPGGRTVLALMPVWSGKIRDGEDTMRTVLRFGQPVMSEIHPQTYIDTFRMADAHIVEGHCSYWNTQHLIDLNDRAIAILVQAAEKMTSPDSVIVVSEFHGAASRTPADATPFALRRNHYMAQIVANWASSESISQATSQGEDDGRHRLWADEVSRELAADALPGGYVNFLKRTEQDRAKLFYGPNAARLLQVKRKYDPGNLFRSAPGAIVD